MNTKLDDQIRTVVSDLAEAAGKPAPFTELPIMRPAPALRRPRMAGVAIGAATAAIVLVGLPLMLLRGPAPVDEGAAPVAISSTIDSTSGPETSEPTVSTGTVPTTALTVPPAVSPLAGFSVSGLQWVKSTAYTGVLGSDGVQSFAADVRSGPKSIAWDGEDGLVYVSNGDELWWVTPTKHDRVADLGEFSFFDEQPLLDVVLVDEVPFAVMASLNGDPVWINLHSGVFDDTAAAKSDRRFETGETLRIAIAGIAVYIEEPDWSSVARGEGGEPLPPFALPVLVIEGIDGSDPVRIEVGSEQQPIARVHDFDGYRLIYSVEPYEPALPSRTVYVVDIDCVDCSEGFVTEGPADWFDLINDSTR